MLEILENLRGVILFLTQWVTTLKQEKLDSEILKT